MITVFCFILPMLLFLITLPIKIVLKSWEVTLKMIEKGEKDSFLSRLDSWSNSSSDGNALQKWSDTDNSLGSDLKSVGKGAVNGAKGTLKAGKTAVKVGGKTLKYGYKTAKTGAKVIKKGYQASKTAVKVTKQAVKALVKFIRLVIHAIKVLVILIKALITALIAMGTVGIVILVVIVVALIIACVCSVLFINGSGDSSSSGGGFSGYDYSKIDWSQDFSVKLNEIESTSGKQARDWAELVIISMNTGNKNSNIAPPIQNWWAGFKRVESGVEVMADSQKTEHPITDYSYIEVDGNHAGCFGPMQIKISGSKANWTKFNSAYEPKNTVPKTDTRDSSLGSVFFYPDCALGTLTAFKTNLSSWSNLDYINDAFTKCGVSVTDTKRDRVLYTLSAIAYNSGSLPTSSGSDKAKMTEAVAIYTIKFFEKYGYEYNEKQVKLVNSIAKKQGQDMKSPAPTVDGFRNALVGWDVSRSDFSACYNSTTDYGVLDENGSAVQGSLLHYVMKDSADDVQSFVKDGMQIYWGKGDNETMPYYGIYVYACSLYSVDKVVDLFGLRNQVTTGSKSGSGSGGTIVDVATREGKAQGSERIVYVLGGDGAYQADCARFVASVLTESGYSAFGITASNHSDYKAHEDRSALVSEAGSHGGGVDCSSETAWVKANQPQAIVWEGSAGSLDTSKLQAGDICYRGGSHTFIYMGKNASGVEYICHASSSNSSSFSCSDDPDNLDKQPKYGFGFGKFTGYHQQSVTFVFRPSQLK